MGQVGALSGVGPEIGLDEFYDGWSLMGLGGALNWLEPGVGVGRPLNGRAWV